MPQYGMSGFSALCTEAALADTAAIAELPRVSKSLLAPALAPMPPEGQKACFLCHTYSGGSQARLARAPLKL